MAFSQPKLMHALSKPEFDIGFFTNRVEDTLAFWREEIGLSCEPPVHFNDGLVQYRHRLGSSVIKINGADGGVDEKTNGGYGDLYIDADLVKANLRGCSNKTDPNGQVIHFVPNAAEKLCLEIPAANIDKERDFLLNALGCSEEPTGKLRLGNCAVTLKHAPDLELAGHWVNAGFRYFTVHVMRVDEAYQKIIDNGGAEGEKPYAIGDIAKISFVRSPAGHWIEVAQRRELAGAW